MKRDNGWEKLEKKIIGETGKYLEGRRLDEEVEKIKSISKKIQNMNKSLVSGEY